MDNASLYAALSQYAATHTWRYVYPALSRRAQGISLGINLHPNKACHWQCIYCQVSGLHRGASPDINMSQLKKELQDCWSWLEAHVTKDHQTIANMVSDIAFAGEGEPTASPQFAEAVHLVVQQMSQRPRHKRPQSLRLITNGRQMHHASVQYALGLLNYLDGEVWFKLDAGTEAEIAAINQVHLSVTQHLERLNTCSALCRTWVQTAVLSQKTAEGAQISSQLDHYLAQLAMVKNKIAGVLLYSASRPSQQTAGKHLQTITHQTLNGYAKAIRHLGVQVRLFL